MDQGSAAVSADSRVRGAREGSAEIGAELILGVLEQRAEAACKEREPRLARVGGFSLLQACLVITVMLLTIQDAAAEVLIRASRRPILLFLSRKVLADRIAQAPGACSSGLAAIFSPQNSLRPPS